MSTAVGFDDVRKAAAVIRCQVVQTPCTHSRVLCKITSTEVWAQSKAATTRAWGRDAQATIPLAYPIQRTSRQIGRVIV